MSDANPPQFPIQEPGAMPPNTMPPNTMPPGPPAAAAPLGHVPQDAYPNAGQVPVYAYGPPRKTNGFAITALACGIAGFMLVLPAFAGIGFGHAALSQLKADPSQEGRGMAIAGLVCGYVTLALIIMYIALIVVVLGIFASAAGTT